MKKISFRHAHPRKAQISMSYFAVFSLCCMHCSCYMLANSPVRLTIYAGWFWVFAGHTDVSPISERCISFIQRILQKILFKRVMGKTYPRGCPICEETYQPVHMYNLIGAFRSWSVSSRWSIKAPFGQADWNLCWPHLSRNSDATYTWSEYDSI